MKRNYNKPQIKTVRAENSLMDSVSRMPGTVNGNEVLVRQEIPGTASDWKE